MEGNARLTRDNRIGMDFSDIPERLRGQAVSAETFSVTAPIAAESAEQAYASVLAGAGATLPKRDEVDARIVAETKKGTAKGKGSFGKPGIIDRAEAVGGWPQYHTLPPPVDTDKDGMPDDWEKKNGLDPGNPLDRNHTGKDGYTMLEKYLNSR